VAAIVIVFSKRVTKFLAYILFLLAMITTYNKKLESYLQNVEWMAWWL